MAYLATAILKLSREFENGPKLSVQTLAWLILWRGNVYFVEQLIIYLLKARITIQEEHAAVNDCLVL